MQVIFSSDGIELHFPSLPLQMEYARAERLLQLKYYVKVRNEHGIWAGNQNKFVEHVDDLRPMDGRHMEMLLSRHADELDIEIEPHRGRVKLNGKV